MNKDNNRKPIGTIILVLALAIVVFGGYTGYKKITKRAGYFNPNNISLAEPQKTGGMPLMEALAKRRSARNFAQIELSNEVISNLLWAANGKSGEGKRTAPSARNKQEIDLYLLIPSGIYKYNADHNILEFISDEDLTKSTGYNSPLSIVFVANLDEQVRDMALVDCGFIGQNIYLFATSNNLISVFKATFDRKMLMEKLNLSNRQEVLFIHDVGYAAD